MTLTEWALLTLLSLLWGGSFFFSKVAVQALPPLTVVLVRVSLAAAALGLYLRFRRIFVPKAADVWLSFAGMGALNNLIPFALIFWSQTVISSGLASILMAMTPVFSVLVAHAFTRDERLSVNKIAGIALGVAGVVALVGTEALAGSKRAPTAILACLGAALSYGFANVFGRRFRSMGVAPAVGAFGQIAATAVMMVPIVLVFDDPWRLPVPDRTVMAALFGLAILSTALAYIIFFHLLSSAGAVNTSLVTLLIPLSAIGLGRLFLGERLSISQFGGMALIGLGFVAIDGRVWSPARRRP